MLIVCIDCGKAFEGRHNQVRCPECQEKYRKKLMSYKNRRKQSYVDPVLHYFTCGHKDCRFAMTGDHILMCDYMAVHTREHPEADSHKRPCPATPDCKCYEKGRRKRWRWF